MKACFQIFGDILAFVESFNFCQGIWKRNIDGKPTNRLPSHG
jgi:hypothetical protein